MIHLLLCGGSGTRLWPLSRKLMPKQFLPLFDGLSLFQKTFLGNRSLCEKTLVVCNAAHYNTAKKQIDACNCGAEVSYLLEPLSRNTATAISLAVNALPSEEIVLVTPSDHLIEYSDPYFDAVHRAEHLAKNGSTAIFGIVPNSPETGYGYIQADGEEVRHFHEKPDFETAIKFISGTSFFWNSGMLCFQARIFCEMMPCHAPEIFSMASHAFQRAIQSSKPDHTIEIKADDMENIPSLSIDVALLEKAHGLKMVRGNFRWSDLGSFDSLHSQYDKDELGNALGIKKFHGINAKNNLVISDRLVAAIDVENLAIIDTHDSLLIVKLGSTQKVKELISQL